MATPPIPPPSPFNISVDGLSNATLFQLYCINPPDDSCPHGPCPNPDVTGFGQQVSLYITATIFAITLVHSTDNFRYAWYGYIANVYSLLVASVISIRKGLLTQNDAVFVIVAVASPATLYLWLLSISMAVRFMRRKRMPSYLSKMNKVEQALLFALSTCLLGFWFGVFVIVVGGSAQFSQPGCDKEWGATDLAVLVWAYVPVFNGVFMMAVLLLLVKWVGKPQSKIGDNDLLSMPEDNLFRWTQDSTRKVFDRHGYLFWKHSGLGLFLMVVDRLLSGGMATYSLVWKDVRVGIEAFACLVVVLVFLHDTIRCRARPGIVDVLLLLALTGLAVSLHWTQVSSIVVATHAIWFMNFWNQRHESAALRRRVLYSLPPFIVFFLGLSVLFYRFSGLGFRYLFAQLIWFMTWVLCAYEPSARAWENIRRMWFAIVHASPVFKSVILVVEPTIMWITATLTANPTKSSSSSFGQIYAMLTSIASLSSLILLIFDRPKEFGAAFSFLRSEPPPPRYDSVPVTTTGTLTPASTLLNISTSIEGVEGDSYKRRPRLRRSVSW